MKPLVWSFDASVTDHVTAHAIEVHGARVQDTGNAFARLAELGRTLRERHRGTTIGAIEGIADARRLYRAFGIDPTRTRPSSEALLRRCIKGQDLYRINEAVDVCNWVSLEFLIPIGLYDRDRIVGDTTVVRVGSEGEEFAGIRKGPVHLTGRLCVSDDTGAFGSPTSDSLRTSVSEGTTQLAAILFAPREMEMERLRAAGHSLASRMAFYCSGSVVLDEPVAG